MHRFCVCWVFAFLILVSCSSKPEANPITSIRFTPLHFPHSNLGEFTLHEAANKEQLHSFLHVFEHIFATGEVNDTITIQDLPNTYSLQLYSGSRLVTIYRLSFDFEQDIAFLQNDQHIYAIAKPDFHQIIESGYFNVIFRKNHAPTAEFSLNGKDIRYSVKGIWNYETYQNNFLSYQINKEPDQVENEVISDTSFRLSYHFPEKQPDEVFETIRSTDGTVENRRLLSSQQITIPANEGIYTYEVEAIWSDSSLPYNATLKYQFRLEVNYPPKVKWTAQANAGTAIAVSVEHYDRNGKLSVSSDLWEKEIPLTLLNQKYHGLLPIPADTAAGEYEVKITGSSSSEVLEHKEKLTVTAIPTTATHVGKKQADLWENQQSQDTYFKDLLIKNPSFTEEKLWSGNFYYPIAASVQAKFGQIFRYRDFRYQCLRIPYRITGNFDVFASANGTVLAVDHIPEHGYQVIIDHGLGLQSIYGGMSEVIVTPGSYIISKQKIGSSDRTDVLPDPVFSYSNAVHGYYIDPQVFFHQDLISLFK